MSDESGSALDPDKIPRRRGLHIRDIKEEAPEPPETVGTELRAAREAAGKEVSELAAALRIKPEHLVALESSEYDKLPAKTYVVGFVRQYAQQLGMDANGLVERVKIELEGPEPQAETAARVKAEAPRGKAARPAQMPVGMGSRPVPPVEEESRLPMTSIIIVVVLLLLVIFGGWYLTRPSGDDNATADTEAETGSKSETAPSSNGGKSGQRQPKPPVIPAAAVEGAPRGGGSLAALLPDADRVSAANAAAEGEPGDAPPEMPDAAAMAVPIERSHEGAVAGETGVNAGVDGVAGTRPGEVMEASMPQPKLALKTVQSHLPGVPEGAGGEGGDGEPVLEEIEAEGVGGEVAAAEAPPPQQRPQTKRPAEEEPAVYGAATVKSRVTLRVRSSAWVRVEDADGRVIIERDMRSGDSFRAPDVSGLYLVTKDAGAIELLLDGESIGRAGRPKQVLTGLLLTPDQLRQRVAQSTAPEIP